MLLKRSGVAAPALRPRAALRLLCTAEHEDIPGLRGNAFRKQLARQRVYSRDVPTSATVNGPIARMATVAVRQEHREALVHDYRESVRAAYERQPGFAGALLLLNGQGAGTTACSITLWDKQGSLDAAVETPEYGEAMQKLRGHFLTAPETKTWSTAAFLLPPAAAGRDAEASSPPRARRKTETIVVVVDGEGRPIK